VTPVIDARWPITKQGRVPIQHQYPLLAALSRLVPEIHHRAGLGIHPIRGSAVAVGQLELTPVSAVTIRTQAEYLPKLLPISGKRLDLAGFPIRLGVAQVLALTVCESLHSRLVTIKGYMEADGFLPAVRRQLDTMTVRPSVHVELGSRRVLRVKSQMIVGYDVTLRGLDDDESIRLQEQGLGGRRHLGCGLFVRADDQRTAGGIAS
jgi:CRISPR-associated protein Cas6